MPAKAWTAVPSSLASCVISEGCAESQEELPELPHRIWLILPLGDTLKKQTPPMAPLASAQPNQGSPLRLGVLFWCSPPPFPNFRSKTRGQGRRRLIQGCFSIFACVPKPCLPLPHMAGPSPRLEITQEIVQKPGWRGTQPGSQHQRVLLHSKP